MDTGTRGLRTRLSAGFLIAGAAAFWTSLSMRAVTRLDGTRTMRVGGWMAAVNHEPTYGTNAALALAFVLWAGAAWFRSVWAWYGGVIAGGAALLLHAFIGAWPGYHGITRLHGGYWLWLAASFLTCAAFALLPRPVRPPPGEPLPRDVADRARTRLAVGFAAIGLAGVLVSHFAVPTVVGGSTRVLADAEEPPSDHDYSVGVTTSSSHSARTVTLPDGTTREERLVFVPEWGPLAVVRLRDGWKFGASCALLLLPLLFLAAAQTRRARWRWGGAVTAAGLILATSLWDEASWPMSSWGVHPLVALWIGTPSVLLAAFVLLPPQRAAAARP